jgi:enterochelin esterase-like enzyme
MAEAGADCVTFRVADPERRLEGVTLVQEVGRPRLGPTFVRPANGPDWTAALPRPDVLRLEYLLELRHRDGGVETVPDPANPIRAAGPFGDKSVVELPGYSPPAWVSEPPAPSGTVSEALVPSRSVPGVVNVVLWTSAGHDHDDELPLLLAHDGVEYALYSGLLALLDRAVDGGRLPPCHVALLVPRDRNRDYSASPAYARALVREVIPEIERHVRVPRRREARVAMGASLGGLAMLHAHRLHPGSLGALFLQSPSLFLAGVDDHEAWLDHHPRIVRFVGGLVAQPVGPRPVPVVMTCGAVEENLHGNRAVAAALAEGGYRVRLEVVRDAHNWTAWRDTFDPHLVGLLTEMWS